MVAQITFVEGRQGQASTQAIEGIVERLRGLAGVEAAAFAGGMPLTMRYGGNTGTMMRIEGRAAPVRVDYDGNNVGPDYFRVMGIELLRGREFTTADRGAARVVIVNEEFVRRYFEGLEPIGRTVFLNRDPEDIPAEVVGVVANSKYRSIGEDRHAALYMSFLSPAAPSRFAHALVKTAGPPEGVMKSIKDAVLQADPTAAVIVEPTTTALAFAFLPSRIGAVLVGSLGALGALLAMIGLYGLVSFAGPPKSASGWRSARHAARLRCWSSATGPSSWRRGWSLDWAWQSSRRARWQRFSWRTCRRRIRSAFLERLYCSARRASRPAGRLRGEP